MEKKNLGRNPFIITPGEHWADREDLWKRIADYIELARHTRSNEIIVLIGDYGCGTTHTLKYLKKYLTEKGAVASYLSIPVDATLLDIYTEFVKDIDDEKKSMIVSKLMDDFGVREDPEKRLGIEETESFFRRLVTRGGVTRPLTLGERDFRRRAGIPDTLPSYKELWLYIISNLSTPAYPVFILIDEFDVASMGMITPNLLNGLRRIYDDSLYGLCLVFGLKGEPKDVRKILGDSLHSRVSLQPIPLYLISKREAIEFLKAILGRNKTKATSPIFPFTEGALQTLVDLSCPTTPRRLLRISSLVFEEACMEKLRIIDEKFVSKIAARYGEISMAIQVPPKEVTKEEEEAAQAEQLLEGAIEYGADGVPKILVAPEKLTAKEVIGLLLYARRPCAVGLRELANLVSRNWRSVNVGYVSANLSQIRQFIITEGKKGAFSYRLSGAGISWIENSLIPRLKA